MKSPDWTISKCHSGYMVRPDDPTKPHLQTEIHCFSTWDEAIKFVAVQIGPQTLRL